jgi:hypothetical protein
VIRIKRAHEEPSPDDGARYRVDGSAAAALRGFLLNLAP